MRRAHAATSTCERLCDLPCSYPCNLSRTNLARRALSVYHQVLRAKDGSPYGKLDLFDEVDHYIRTWDLWDTDARWKSEELETMDHVRSNMHQDMDEPICRFMFLYTTNSREPLCCSREHLEHILTHYQVMAPFLEHVFTFNRRDDPHLQASFRSEDYIWGRHTSPIAESSRIQHCFNLIGVEYDADSTGDPFKYRQTAAYFSLDLISGQTVWLIIKGNGTIRESIEEFTNDYDQSKLLSDTNGSFLFGLHSHLIIYEWAIQTWTPYINTLQQRYAEIAKSVAHTPVVNKTEDDVIDMAVSRKSTMVVNGRQNSGLQTRQSKFDIWKEMIPLVNMPRSQSVTTNQAKMPASQASIIRPDITKIFSFDKLQKLHRVATQVQTGLSVLDQNKTVLQAMLKHFQYLQESEDFCQSVKIVREDFQSFVYKTEHCIGELEHQHHRLRSIQLELERTISLFNGIVEHHNMRTGESYARAAKVSTEKMEEITVKTKQETVSIHAITILTLIFLPATFVATFFGSGVIDFEKEDSHGKWGFWEVRWGALMLFGAVFGPLTGAVVAAWAFTYIYSRRHQQRSTHIDQGAMV